MKKTFGKRLICAFISILMVMMLLPTGVFADDATDSSIEINGTTYGVIFSEDCSLEASSWGTITLSDTASFVSALQTEDALVLITRSNEASSCTFESFVFVDSWWNASAAYASTGYYTRTDDEGGVAITYAFDTGTVVAYNASDISSVFSVLTDDYISWGDSAQIITNTDASYTVTNISVVVEQDSGDEEDPDEDDEDETTYYTITLPEVNHATVTADKTSATEGDEVTATVNLDDGYSVSGLTFVYWVSENYGYGLSYTDNGDGSYTFTMPAYDVEVLISVGSFSITTEYSEDGGYVSCNPYADAGNTVYAYVFVYYGYELSGDVTVVDDNGNIVELTEVDTLSYNSDAGTITYYVYTFTMPESAVTVSASFSEDEDAPEIGIAVYNYAVNDFTYFYDVDWTDSNTYLEITYQLNYESDDDVDNYADWQSGAVNAIGDDHSWNQLYWLPSYGESGGTYTISLTDLAAIVEEAGYSIDNGVLIDWWVGADDYATLLNVQLVTVEPSTEHEWNDGVITTAPTCTTAGVKTYTCTTCGETYTESVPATGHTAGTAVIENYVKVTADADGSYDTVTYCTVCGEEISRSHTVIAAYGSGSAEVIDWATVLAGANSSNDTNTTVEDVVIEEPIEPTDTETEDDGEEEPTAEPTVETEAPAETNPTTGVALSLIPMAIAALAAVSSKRR